MKLPIIIIEQCNGDVAIFANQLDLARGLEPADVKAGEYFAFDSSGNKLELTEGGLERDSSLFGKVNIPTVIANMLSIQSDHSTQLRSYISAYLLRFEQFKNLEHTLLMEPLEKLIDRVVSLDGYSK